MTQDRAPPELITIGNVCVDLFVPAHEHPPPGGITLIPSLQLVPGGNGANTAITAARLGVRTAVAGVLGDDVLGRYIRDFLLGEGVDISLLQLLPGRTSPATLVFNDAAGERSFVHQPGTNADYALAEETLTTRCGVFHFAAPELLAGLWPEGALEAARRLKREGRTLSLDTFAVEGPFDREEIARLHRPFLALMDMAFPNESEARLVTGRDDPRAISSYLHDLGVRVVAVKRGERGATVSWGGRFEEVPARAVPVVDTCGAGDNFAAGFLAGYLRGLDPLDATRLGCALGTLCVANQGSTTATSDPIRLGEALAAFPRLKAADLAV